MDAMQLLASTGLFEILDEAALRAVAEQLEPVRVPGGENLFRQGDPGDALYVLAGGRMLVVIERPDGSEEVVNEMGRGEVVGEMAVLTGEPRSATVRAVRDSALVRFSREAFERVVQAQPKAMLLVARRLVTRLRRRDEVRPPAQMKTLAVVPFARDVPLSDFTRRLAGSLAAMGKTLHLTRETFEARSGLRAEAHEGEAERSDATVWLDRQEASHDFLLYEAEGGGEGSPWTSLCIRQADRVLLLVRGGEAPQVGHAEEELERLCARRTWARKHLVLLHEGDAERPAGTRAWLERIRVEDTHHHVRRDRDDDYGRLARLLTGRPVGLVLGGGGARGLAHVGVIRALEESNVPIDVIGGTSMGSVIAAQYALGLDVPAMLEVNRKGWIDGNPFKDKTIPIVALLACKKLDRMLDMMFGDARIEDLWLPFFCVSANLTRAEMAVHRDGSLAQAVRASLAIPGVALPACEGGDLFVDGGVLNNLPGDVMRATWGGTVIAVEVSPEKDLSIDPSYARTPTSMQVLMSRLNPFRRRIEVPGIGALLMGTLMLASQHRSRQVARDADLCIRPGVDEFGLFEWDSLEAIAEAGYRKGLEAVRAWREGTASKTGPE